VYSSSSLSTPVGEGLRQIKPPDAHKKITSRAHFYFYSANTCSIYYSTPDTKKISRVFTRCFFSPPLSHSGIPSCSNVATTWTNRVAQTNHDPRQPAITGSLGRRPRPLRPPSSPPPLSRFADPLPCRRTRSRPKPQQTNDWSITILGLLDRVNSSSRGLRRPGSCVPLY
jgi:hypothetical protein